MKKILICSLLLIGCAGAAKGPFTWAPAPAPAPPDSEYIYSSKNGVPLGRVQIQADGTWKAWSGCTGNSKAGFASAQDAEANVAASCGEKGT